MRSNPPEVVPSDQSTLKASKLLESSFTGLYTRIQDYPGKDEDWKAGIIDRLETVSVHLQFILIQIIQGCWSAC